MHNHCNCHCRPRYTIFSWLWDTFMVCITCGLWLIWIYVRENRK